MIPISPRRAAVRPTPTGSLLFRSAVATGTSFGSTTAIPVRVVNGVPAGDGVSTEVDVCGCAAGPTTWLFETYRERAFRPASPPGPLPSCSLPALQTAAHAWELSRFACADGWAVAIGAGGYQGQAAGLFEANRADWRVVALDNGASSRLGPRHLRHPRFVAPPAGRPLRAGAPARTGRRPPDRHAGHDRLALRERGAHRERCPVVCSGKADG